MTNEVPGAEAEEVLEAESHEADIDFSAEEFKLPTETEVKQRAYISSLKVQLEAAKSARDFFMGAYADELDSQIERAISGGQASPLEDPEFAAAEARRQEHIRGLERDIEGLQEFIQILTGTNEDLSSDVSRLSEEVESGKLVLASLKTQFRALLDDLKSEHEKETGKLSATIRENAEDAERARIAVQEEHDREVQRLKSEAEENRQEAERRYNQLVEDSLAEAQRKQNEHDEHVALLQREAQEREDGLREEYRLLEQSIPGKLKKARSEGREMGLNLSRMVVESANEMGLDKMSSSALSAIIQH